MKEYITLKVLTKGMNIVVYFKDSNRTIVHRENDKPARVWLDGAKGIFKNNNY
jgi:hypothetical protein